MNTCGLFRGWIVIVMLLCGVVVSAGETGHYPLGSEGLRSGSLPPPGVYFRTYATYYKSNRLMTAQGRKAPVDFEVTTIASAQRFIWITDTKLFGGNLAMDMIIPLVSNEFEMSGTIPFPFRIYDKEEGVADIFLEPFALTWHGKQWDAAAGYMVAIPTGEYHNNEPASIGKDFWSHIFTAGGTLYFDEQRKWHAAILSRYEIHNEKDDKKVTPGDNFEFEWGIGRTFKKVLDVGISGYCQWQVRDDEGVDRDSDAHDKAYAIGPEISSYLSKKTHLSLRYLKEFDVEDRPEGENFTLTFSIIF